jgi:hypothetical protein
MYDSSAPMAWDRRSAFNILWELSHCGWTSFGQELELSVEPESLSLLEGEEENFSLTVLPCGLEGNLSPIGTWVEPDSLNVSIYMDGDLIWKESDPWWPSFAYLGHESKLTRNISLRVERVDEPTFLGVDIRFGVDTGNSGTFWDNRCPRPEGGISIFLHVVPASWVDDMDPYIPEPTLLPILAIIFLPALLRRRN